MFEFISSEKFKNKIIDLTGEKIYIVTVYLLHMLKKIHF